MWLRACGTSSCELRDKESSTETMESSMAGRLDGETKRLWREARFD